MSPLVAYHATRPACRDSIRTRGLLAARPTFSRPFGVYVFRDDGGFNHPTYGKSRAFRCVWCAGPADDVWQVAYIGRVIPDHFVINGMILLDSVPPNHVTLVTGNSE